MDGAATSVSTKDLVQIWNNSFQYKKVVAKENSAALLLNLAVSISCSNFFSLPFILSPNVPYPN